MKRTFLFICLFLFIQNAASAEVLDRVVAFINDNAITLSELNAEYSKMALTQPDITKEEVLTTMINRFLLIREANALRLEADSNEELLNEYVELKIRTFIRIQDEEIEAYYNSNRDKFRNVPLEKVKDSIERLLTEKELNKRLKQHIEEIRKKAYIKIFLDSRQDG